MAKTLDNKSLFLKARIVRGIAHPPGEPDDYNGLKLTQKEIFEKYQNLPGTIVYDNHDLSKPIGKVLGVTIGDDGALCMDALLNQDHPHSREVLERVLAGDYRGMSLGMDHSVDMKTGHVHNSNINELSLCPDGDMPGTIIRTVANDKSGMQRPFQTKWFDFGTEASSIEVHSVESPYAPATTSGGGVDTSGRSAGSLPGDAPLNSGVGVGMNKKSESTQFQHGGTSTTMTDTAPTLTPTPSGTLPPATTSPTGKSQSPPPPPPSSPPSKHHTESHTHHYYYYDEKSGNVITVPRGDANKALENMIRLPTPDDPYHRNAAGQFAKKVDPPVTTPTPERSLDDGGRGLPHEKDTNPNLHTEPAGGNDQSVASAIADALRGGGYASETTSPSTLPGVSPTSIPPTTQEPAAAASSSGDSAPASTAAPTETQERRSGSGKAAIDQEEYEKLLTIRMQHEEMLKKQEEIMKNNEELEKRVKEWENIGATLGGPNPEEAKRVVEDMKRKEAEKMRGKINEIMPMIEKIWMNAEGANKDSIEPIVRNLKNYQFNKDALLDTSNLESAKGLVEIVTTASREHNTRFSQQEARIKELQRKNAEAVKRAEEERKRAEELSQKNALFMQSGSSLGGKTIDPTVVGGNSHHTSQQQQSSAPSSMDQRHTTTVSTTASSGSKKRKDFEPFANPPGWSSGSLLSEIIASHGGDIRNLRTTASASSGGSSGGTETFEQFQRRRAQESKRVRVSIDSVEADIDVRPWNIEDGFFAKLGDDYIGNRTYKWIEQGIKNGGFNEAPVVINVKDDELRTVYDW